MASGKPTRMSHLSRRGFLQAMGTTTAAGLSMNLTRAAADSPVATARQEATAVVRGAFVYPPTEKLRKVGYYSWPGSTFDAEGKQKEYMARIRQMEEKLGIRIVMDEKPLDTEADTTRFINEVKHSKPDGLLLIPFKKGHWPHVVRIVEETQVPSVVLATLGVLLVGHIRQLHDKAGAYLVSSLDDLDSVEDGMKMIRTAYRMRNNLLLDIRGSEPGESTVPHLGTTVRRITHERFYATFDKTKVTDDVKRLAKSYRRGAKDMVEPDDEDVLQAARCYFALKSLIEEEKAGALMMDCLPGLKKPHKHVPPCMGFMTLRDEGIPAGCQSDLNATLSLMLVQELFGKPGFQQNAAMDTERNLYFGAHCTSASKMNGVDEPPEPFILRNHAEAGWGCVPRVLYSEGQPATIALYESGDKPQMIVYTGEIVECPPIPPTGGCRSNLLMTINEVDDVCDVKGMHQTVFYGDHGDGLRKFCQLFRIPVVT